MNIKRQIFNFIADHHTRLDYLPTQSEIRKTFAGLTDDVDLHLEQLHREGLVELSRTGEDSILLPRTFPPVRRIELRGMPCSRTVSTDTPSIQYSVALDLRGAGVALDGDLFAQIVGDDSMVDAGIASGDVAILKAVPPERGEIVVVEESGQLVLRRFVIIAGIPHFLAENPLRPDLTVAYDKPTLGVLWCLICTQPSGRGGTGSPINKVTYLKDNRSALESEFLKMLKLNLKEGPKIQRRTSGHSPAPEVTGKSKKRATIRNKSVGHDYNWPKPPSGTALNDKRNPDYRVAPQKLVLDERPERAYGGASSEALAQFALQERQARDAETFDSPASGAGEPPQGAVKIATEGVRHDQSR